MNTQNVTQNGNDEVKLASSKLDELSSDRVESRGITGDVDFYDNRVSTDPAYVAQTYAATLNGTPYTLYRVPNADHQTTDVCPASIDRITPNFFQPEIMNFGIRTNGTATIEIRLQNNVPITNYMIRPKRYNLLSGNRTYSATLSSGRIILTVRGPQLLCVEINSAKTQIADQFRFDDPVIGKSLLIFANPFETNIPSNPNYNYSANAQPYSIGTVTLQSNQTVYIAPGAIVHGTFRTAPGATNVRIMGRGILSGKNVPPSNSSYKAPYMIALNKATNSSVEGVILVNSKDWTMPLFGCENITFDWVKIASYTGFEDGIDVVGCRNVWIRDCFIWTKDDCIAVKCGVNYNWTDFNNGITGLPPGQTIDNAHIYNINVNNCVIWNGSRANALEIGCELNAYRVEHIKFHHIDIIHALNPCDQDEGALSINNNGNGRVNTVEYFNIYIEDVQRYFMNIKIEQTRYSPGGSEFFNIWGTVTYTGGYVYDIYYDNIFLTKYSALHSAFVSANYPGPSNLISSVNIRNFYINGNRISQYHPFPDTATSNNFVLVSQGNVNFNDNSPNW